MINIVKNIAYNVLIALYQPFWFSILLAVLFLFFYLYAYHPIETGQGLKRAWSVWWKCFRTNSFFRRLFFFTFYTTMILFQTLMNRNIWMNPLLDVMSGWWIWTTNSSTGETTLTTTCFENLILYIPFTTLLLRMLEEKQAVKKAVPAIIGQSVTYAFLMSTAIEFLQLFLRLGLVRLSDVFYCTLGGAIGGIIYCLHKFFQSHFK